MYKLIILLLTIGFASGAWNCWNGCGHRSGPCASCGAGGKCCRQGWGGGGCPSFDGCFGYHCCGLGDCWNSCGHRGGPCSACLDSGKACCRKGWTADPIECGKGLKGCNGYHCCVKQATNAEICGSKIDKNWKLIDMKYHVDKSNIIKLPPKVVVSKYLDNKAGSTTQSLSFTATESHTETKSFTHTAGLSVAVGTEFSVGVPAIAEGKVSVEVTASYEFSYGKENSVTKDNSATFNCAAPPGNYFTSYKTVSIIL